MNNQLEEFRKQIDSIDSQLIELLSKRFQVVKQIGNYKKENNLKALDSNRWNKVMDNLLEKAQDLKLDEDIVTAIWNEIHNKSLEIEKKE